VTGWYKRRAGALATVFSLTTVALTVAVVYQTALLHGHGWQLDGGALLTLIGTLIGGVGGVALTHWSQESQYRRQSSDKHRLEMRESIASVLDQAAALNVLGKLVYLAGDALKDQKAGKWREEQPLPESVLVFNKELAALNETTNKFRYHYRRALLVVDDDALAEKLSAIQEIADEIDLDIHSIQDRTIAGEPIDVAKIDHDLSELAARNRMLGEAAVARLVR
jgi:hypothetical protein